MPAVVRDAVADDAVRALPEFAEVQLLLRTANAFRNREVTSLRFTDLQDVNAPAVLWRPATGVRPLVLLGHGGSGHKSSARITALAVELVERYGLACVAIDGPFHGDRAPKGSSTTDYQRLMAEVGMDNIIDALNEDWINVINVISERVDTSRIAYIGMSMGTRFGLPLLARLGRPMVRAAVLGKFGLRQEGLHLSLQSNARTLADASAVKAPIHFHAQISDVREGGGRRCTLRVRELQRLRPSESRCRSGRGGCRGRCCGGCGGRARGGRLGNGSRLDGRTTGGHCAHQDC